MDALDPDRRCATGMTRCQNLPLKGRRLCPDHQRTVDALRRHPMKLWD